MIRIGLLLTLLAALAAPATAATPAEVEAAFRAAFDSRYAAKKRAYETQDVDLIVREFYAPDAILFGGDDTPADFGSAQIRADFAGFINNRVGLKIEQIESRVSDDGTLGYDWTVFTPISPNGPLKPETILFVWRKTAAGWRCVAEMYVHRVIERR